MDYLGEVMDDDEVAARYPDLLDARCRTASSRDSAPDVTVFPRRAPRGSPALGRHLLDARRGEAALVASSTPAEVPSAAFRFLLELRDPFGFVSYVDAVDPARSNLGRYINHASPANLRKVRQRYPARALRFYAARDIAPGEELSFDYGDTYWSGREGELVS